VESLRGLTRQAPGTGRGPVRHRFDRRSRFAPARIRGASPGLFAPALAGPANDLRRCPMRNFSIASVLFMALTACGGGGNVGNEVQGWADKVCKCADKACVDKTYDEYRTWRKGKKAEMKEMSKEDRQKFKESEGPKIDKAEDEMRACRKKYDDKPAESPTE
jgi:hypothetical protein